MELGADLRDPEGMVDELLARAALLARVGALGEAEGAGQKVSVQPGKVGLDLADQLVDEILMTLVRLDDSHLNSVLLPPEPTSSATGMTCGLGGELRNAALQNACEASHCAAAPAR